MGWLFTDRYQSFASKDEFLRREFDNTSKDNTVSRRVIKSAFVGSTWYAAFEISHVGQPTRVVALIVLTEMSDGQFGYKAMDETVGPYECSCPLSIMNLLTPVLDGDGSYAADWRRRAEEHHKSTSALLKTKRRLKAGDRVVFAKPATFSGVEVKGGVLVLHRTRKRSTLVLAAAGMLCRISREMWSSIRLENENDLSTAK